MVVGQLLYQHWYTGTKALTLRLTSDPTYSFTLCPVTQRKNYASNCLGLSEALYTRALRALITLAVSEPIHKSL